MRSILAFSLLIALITSADAATMRHSSARHHLFVSPSVASSFDAAVPRLEFGSSDYADTPSYNDPSKSGGSTALPISD